MLALTMMPGRANSARVEDMPEPREGDGAVLARALAVGVCGTDLEIVAGAHGTAAAGRERLAIGHESLARVEAAPAASGLTRGDLCLDGVPLGGHQLQIDLGLVNRNVVLLN